MKATLKDKRNSIPLACFCAVVFMWIITETVFMRFVHYDSQYRLLNPEHYNVEVITEEDHKKLSNPENKSVMLSSGITLTKGDIWDSRVLPNYKSVKNASQYVLVTVKGTAPFIDRWYSNIIPISIICIIGFFWGMKYKRFEEQQTVHALDEKVEQN
ncbi:MAG: hypothetical protein ACYSUC_05405 [Planctomycetota bacterium]|jgi:hypothetical protein